MKWKNFKEEFVFMLECSAALLYPVLLILIVFFGHALYHGEGPFETIPPLFFSILIISMRVFFRWFKHDLSTPKTSMSPRSVIAFGIYFGIIAGIPLILLLLDLLMRFW